MHRLVPIALVLAIACTSAAPPNPYRPAVNIQQITRMNFGATTAAPVTIEVEVKNTSSQPMTIRRVRLEGGLQQQYRVGPFERVVNETVPPGETGAVRLLLTAYSQQGRIDDPEPLNLRGFVTYEVGGKPFEDFYVFQSIVQ